MAFTCSAQVDADCVGDGLWNAAYESDDGQPVCVMCALELGLTDRDV
ncbi:MULTISPECIES: hypothetical protein [unclassified Haloferax]|nr:MULTISPECIES: hypothetical protein [unclassified Haloferax]